MKLYTALGLKEKMMIALVGGGGKTTIMYRLAEEIPRQRRVLITTTTKIFIPPPATYPYFCREQESFDEKQLIKSMDSGIRPVLGSKLIPGNKLQGVELDFLLHCWYNLKPDYILVEADGSKGRPLKGYLDYEPVIPKLSNQILIVIGADVLGKRLEPAFVHRPEVVADLLHIKPGTVITPDLVTKLLAHPQGLISACPPEAEKVIIINKMDCLPEPDEARELARLMIGTGMSKALLCSAADPDPVKEIII